MAAELPVDVLPLVRVEPFTGDLWLTAHDSTKFKPRLPSRTLGIALASGLLIELLLGGWVFLDAGGRLCLRQQAPPNSAALGRIVRDLRIEQDRRIRRPLREQGLPGQNLRDWITYLAVDNLAHELVAERLAQAGALVDEKRRTLLGRWTTRWTPADSTVSGRPANRIATALERGTELSLFDLIIGALYLATGLDGHALAVVEQPGRAELTRKINNLLPATVLEILRTADASIGESTMTGHG